VHVPESRIHPSWHWSLSERTALIPQWLYSICHRIGEELPRLNTLRAYYGYLLRDVWVVIPVPLWRVLLQWVPLKLRGGHSKVKAGLCLVYTNRLLIPRLRLGSQIFELSRHQLVLARRSRGPIHIWPLRRFNFDVTFIAFHYVLKCQLRLLHGHYCSRLCRALPLGDKLMRLKLSLAHVAIVRCLHQLLIGSWLQVKQLMSGWGPWHISTQAKRRLGKLRSCLYWLSVVGVKFLYS
jgi:hypothetical protein